MRHIDSMSKLREEVAFEWYAQRDPLVVYKEKAYLKFSDLIDEVSYKVIKALFSIDKNTEIEQNQINLENLDINEEELKNMLNNVMSEEDENKKQNIPSNPLFNAPNTWNVDVKKTKIRV